MVRGVPILPTFVTCLNARATRPKRLKRLTQDLLLDTRSLDRIVDDLQHF
jgi:hypothetical protein